MANVLEPFFNNIGKTVIEIFSCDYDELYGSPKKQNEELLLDDGKRYVTEHSHEAEKKCWCLDSYSYLWQIVTIDQTDDASSIKLYEYICSVSEHFDLGPADALNRAFDYLKITDFRIRPLTYFGDEKFLFKLGEIPP